MSMGTFAIKAVTQIDNPDADTLNALKAFADGMARLSSTNWADLGTQAASAYKLTQDELSTRDAAAQAVSDSNNQLIALNDKMQQVKKDIIDAQAQAALDVKIKADAFAAFQGNAHAEIARKHDGCKAREDAVTARENAVLERENAATAKENQLSQKETSLANQQTVIDGIKSDLSSRMTAVEQREQKLLNN